MSLTKKERELINIGASIATGCKPWIDYHFEKAGEAGVSPEEIKKAISDAVFVRDNAKVEIESHGLQQLGIEKPGGCCCGTGESSRITELVSIAAAFALNCTSSLERHIAAAKKIGICEIDIKSVLDSALFIKGEAAHYVEQIVSLEKKYDDLEALYEELQRTQAKLLQSEKMAALGKLVAMVVHEINTPLGVLNSTSDISIRSISKINEVLETSNTLEEVKENRLFQNSLKALRQNHPTTTTASQRILRIVSSLKSFARLDEAEFQKADLHEGIESVLILLEQEFANRIEIVKDFGKIPPILCYPGELNQVFMHLLANAAKAIPKTGIIKISTFVENASVQIQISDTGIGIPCEKLKTIFEPCFAADGSRVKAGFGLFTSFNIIQKHKGTLKAQSVVGKGSTFSISLPVNLAQIQEMKKPAEPEVTASRCDRLEK